MNDWEKALDRWLTTPPEDNDPIIVDEFDNGIYDGESYFEINGWVLANDSLDECSAELTEEGETFTCKCCGETFGDDYSDSYYLINGDTFCESCLFATETTAEVNDYE